MSGTVDDQVFRLQRGPNRDLVFKAVVGGCIIDAEWPDRDSALAGLRAAVAARRSEDAALRGAKREG